MKTPELIHAALALVSGGSGLGSGLGVPDVEKPTRSIRAAAFLLGIGFMVGTSAATIVALPAQVGGLREDVAAVRSISEGNRDLLEGVICDRDSIPAGRCELYILRTFRVNPRVSSPPEDE